MNEERTLRYKLPGGGFVTIGKPDIPFLESLQELPVDTKIVMMRLTEDEVNEYFQRKKAFAVKWITELLSQKWYWRETGERAEILPEMIPAVSMTTRRILANLKKTPCPMTAKQLAAIIEFYTGDHAEIYTKK